MALIRYPWFKSTIIFVHGKCLSYYLANWHISDSLVTRGAEFRARFCLASMMALILLTVKFDRELAA